MRFVLALLILSLYEGLASSKTIDLTREALTPDTFNPVSLLITANKLIALGSDDAYRSLLKYADLQGGRGRERSNRDYYVGWLCLLVYEKRPGNNLEDMDYGAPDFPTPSSRDVWPLFPLVMIDETPFLLVSGYMVDGKVPSGADYLEAYHQNGLFRRTPYPLPSEAEADHALTELLSSRRWIDLHWMEPEFLHKDAKIRFLQQQVDRIR